MAEQAAVQSAVGATRSPLQPYHTELQLYRSRSNPAEGPNGEEESREWMTEELPDSLRLSSWTRLVAIRCPMATSLRVSRVEEECDLEVESDEFKRKP